MFAGFNLEFDINYFKKIFLENERLFEHYKEIGEIQLQEKKVLVKKSLSNYILSENNGIIDGTTLQSDWFPQVKADIFISHSHKDKELSMALAGWLYDNFNLHCFIDSCVWGYIDELLEIINAKYSDKRSNNGDVVYNHQKCNRASAHVNMILNIALQKMIDSTEAVFLINTPNSIEKYSQVYDSSTFSPWIYSEIICTEIIRKKELSEYRKKKIYKNITEQYNANDELQVEYDVPLEHLIKLEWSHLRRWEIEWKKINVRKDKYALDELYKITNPKVLESSKALEFAIN